MIGVALAALMCQFLQIHNIHMPLSTYSFTPGVWVTSSIIASYNSPSNPARRTAFSNKCLSLSSSSLGISTLGRPCRHPDRERSISRCRICSPRAGSRRTVISVSNALFTSLAVRIRMWWRFSDVIVFISVIKAKSTHLWAVATWQKLSWHDVASLGLTGFGMAQEMDGGPKAMSSVLVYSGEIRLSTTDQLTRFNLSKLRRSIEVRAGTDQICRSRVDPLNLDSQYHETNLKSRSLTENPASISIPHHIFPENTPCPFTKG